MGCAPVIGCDTQLLENNESAAPNSQSDGKNLLIATCPPGIVKAMRRQENKTGNKTIILRNIPLNYSRSMLVDLLKQGGFSSVFNLIYLPIDFQKNASLGYAFVNFVNTEDAQKALNYFH